MTASMSSAEQSPRRCARRHHTAPKWRTQPPPQDQRQRPEPHHHCRQQRGHAPGRCGRHQDWQSGLALMSSQSCHSRGGDVAPLSGKFNWLKSYAENQNSSSRIDSHCWVVTAPMPLRKPSMSYISAGAAGAACISSASSSASASRLVRRPRSGRVGAALAISMQGNDGSAIGLAARDHPGLSAVLAYG